MINSSYIKSIKDKQAFTLIELLVVITIIGLLSTLAIFALNSARLKARDSKRMSDLKIISQTLERYNIDNSGYPVDSTTGPCGGDIISINDEMCVGSDLSSETDTYMDQLPTPPLGIDGEVYVYDDESYNPPCVYTVSFESNLEKSGGLFWCQSGQCEIYNTDNPDRFCSNTSEGIIDPTNPISQSECEYGGGIWNEDNGGSCACTGGRSWNIDTLQCSCLDGLYWNGVECTIDEMQPLCPEGQSFNHRTDQCEPDGSHRIELN